MVVALVATVLTVTLTAPATGGQEVGADDPPAPVGLLPVPSPLPGGPAGTLIASAPFPVDGLDDGVEAHQILYLSTDRFGQPTPVSGFVLVPVGVPAPPGGRPVVAMAHGTTGITDGCAPSLAAQWGGLGVDDPQPYLDAGAVVISTDYPGMGTPGLHPYLDGISEGRAVLDSIRAAAAFGGTGPAVVTGLSQGGHATLFAGAEWATYAPEIDLRGVAPVAAPTLMSAAYAARAALPNASAYVGIILSGIVVARPDLDASELLRPSGLAAMDRLAAIDDDPEQCGFNELDVDADIRADPLDLPDWRAAMIENEPGSRSIDVPVLMVGAEGDSTVPPFMTELICQGLTTLGTDLRLWMYGPDNGHVGAALVSADDRAVWLLDVLAGDPPARTVAWSGEVPAVADGCVAVPEPPTRPADPDDPPAAGPAPAPPAVPVTTRARFTG